MSTEADRSILPVIRIESPSTTLTASESEDYLTKNVIEAATNRSSDITGKVSLISKQKKR